MKADMKAAENAVISGSLVDWGDELIPFFTLAVRVITDTDLRIKRLKQREYEAFGKRVLTGGDMYETHIEFLEWAGAYDTGSVNTRSKAKHDEWQKLLICPLISLNGADDLNENVAKVKHMLKTHQFMVE